MEDFYVEVVNARGIWCRALLVDFDDKGVLVKYDSKNGNVVRVGYNETRLPQQSATTASTFKTGEECEVFNEASNDDEPNGWWPATVKIIRGEFYVVNYRIQNSPIETDIVPLDKMRVPNRNGPLQANFLHKIVFPVPDDLKEIYRTENPSKDFRKACNAISVHYDQKANTLSVICDNDSGIKRAKILSETHFKGLRQKVVLLKRTQELTQQLEKSRLQMSANYRDRKSVV